MHSYVILMRGINVGGKNRVPMLELKQYLEELGFKDVITYIQSGNVILRSPLSAAALAAKIEDMLPKKFKLDSSIVRVVAIEHSDYKKIVAGAPKKFGKDSTAFRYNVLFLMSFSSDEAIKQILTREGVDEVWQGDQAIYFCNSIAEATKSQLGRITQRPVYKSITIRNWNTTTKLLELLEAY